MTFVNQIRTADEARYYHIYLFLLISTGNIKKDKTHVVRGNRKGAITASELLINAYPGEINRK